MDLASHQGRFFHRTSQRAFYARIVAALVVKECLSLMIPEIEKKKANIKVFIFDKKKSQIHIQLGMKVCGRGALLLTVEPGEFCCAHTWARRISRSFYRLSLH